MITIELVAPTAREQMQDDFDVVPQVALCDAAGNAVSEYKHATPTGIYQYIVSFDIHDSLTLDGVLIRFSKHVMSKRMWFPLRKHVQEGDDVTVKLSLG